MKVFVSGQIQDTAYVTSVQDTLRSKGFEITHDWTVLETGSRFLSGRKDKLDNLDESALRAKNDINGVVECDVYIICTSNQNVGKGMYVELGSALALAQTTGSPRIFTIGEMKHLSVFYLHPLVKRLNNIDEVIEYLKDNKENV